MTSAGFSSMASKMKSEVCLTNQSQKHRNRLAKQNCVPGIWHNKERILLKHDHQFCFNVSQLYKLYLKENYFVDWEKAKENAPVCTCTHIPIHTYVFASVLYNQAESYTSSTFLL